MMLSIAGTAAHAQDDGPIVVGQRHEFEGVRFQDFRAALEFTVRRRLSETRSVAGGRRSERELDVRETLLLATNGYIGHPNLVEFDLLGSFTPSQRRLSPGTGPGATGSEWNFEFIGEHDARFVILQTSDTPLTLYSRRSQSVLSRQFGDSFDSTTMEHGAILVWRSEVLPSQFRYFHREHDTSSRLGFTDFKLVQDTFQWDAQHQPADNQQLGWTYTFDNVRQTGFAGGGQQFQRHDALITHNLDFGDPGRTGGRWNNLRSSLHVYDESGSFDITRLRLSEALRLHHTPRFETRYDYTLNYTARPGFDQTIHRGSAGFRHRLFESLVTSGTVGASHLDISPGGFTSTQYFGDLGAQYHKDVPLGRLSATGNLSYTRQQDSRRDATIQIINEPHSFSAVGLIILQRRFIVAPSIVITDAGGIFTYAQGVDYVVQDFVDRVEIRRVLGGRIADGEAVLVSYLVGSEPAQTTDTFGMRFSVRYDFDEGPLAGLGVYARYFQQDQSRSEDFDLQIPPADIREIIFGADYSIWRLTLLGERRLHESSISPFRSTRLEGRYTQPLGRGSSILATATYLEMNRHEEGLRTEILSLSGRWNQQVTDQLSFGAQLTWRDERNGGSHVQGFEQQVDASWRHRQTTVFGSARNATLRGNDSRSHFQTFFLGLRREF